MDDLDITDDLIRRVADEEHADRRTVTRRILGLPVKGKVALRVDRRLDALGVRRVLTRHAHHVVEVSTSDSTPPARAVG